MELIERLNWRYATKRMNGESIPSEKLNTILESIRLTATSLGFQPFTVYVIESAEWKSKISQEACKQPQVKESSHFIVFAAWKKAGENEIEAYFQNIASTRNVPMESLADFRKAVTGAVTSKDESAMLDWASKQCYIALGTAMVACAMEGVDSTPMEGFDPVAMNRVLGLEEKGQHAAVCLAVGRRNEENDYLVNAKKVRRSADKLFVRL